MKAIYYTFDGETVHTTTNLPTMLRMLTTPHNVYCEATFESYDLEAREQFIGACREAGHNLLTTPNRATDRYRRKNDIEKTDEADCRVIWAIAHKQGTALKRPSPVDKTIKELADKAERELQLARARGTKHLLNEAAEAILGDYGELSDSQKRTLGNGKEYRGPMLAAIFSATQEASSREEFERLLGLYAHGYPSQHRADIHNWARRLEMAQAEKEERPIQPWPEYRKNIRWAYHTIKNESILSN